jgi:hypothetical protein
MDRGGVNVIVNALADFGPLFCKYMKYYFVLLYFCTFHLMDVKNILHICPFAYIPMYVCTYMRTFYICLVVIFMTWRELSLC